MSAPPKAVPRLLRTLNQRTVLEAIRSSAPISRAEIARQTGISKPTVSLALRALLEDGLVRETAHDPARPHYGAVYYEAEPEAALVLGVDLGAGSLRTALCDLNGEVRARRDGRSHAKAAATIDAIGRSLAALVRESGLGAGRVDRAVVGVPAIVSTDGGISSADLPGLEATDLRARLEQRLGIEVRLENDVNLAALAEQRHGVAQEVDDFAFLLVGAGLGAAVVLGGALHRGHNGAAGELDAVRSGHSDDVDPCASALADYAAGLAAAGGDGDVASALAEETARRIAIHVLPLAATLDLPLVVLGGTVGSDERLLEPVRRHLAEWLPFPPRVEVSALGPDAVLDGALAAGVDAALEHVFERRAGG